MLPAQLSTLKAQLLAEQAPVPWLCFGAHLQLQLLYQRPLSHHRLLAWSPAWTQSVGCAVLQVFMSGREEFMVQLKSNLIYACVWGSYMCIQSCNHTSQAWEISGKSQDSHSM